VNFPFNYNGIEIIPIKDIDFYIYLSNKLIMDAVIINMLKKPELKNPVMVCGLPGIGLVGKIAVDHLVDQLKTEKFAELYSPFLPPQVIIEGEGVVRMVKNEFHYHKANSDKGEKHDLILLVGDFQGITPDSQYHISHKILEVANELGVRRIFTLGGLGTGDLAKTPRVYGASNNIGLIRELKDGGYDIKFRGGGGIFGASGLLLGIGEIHGELAIDAVCLMGETHGQFVDPKSSKSVLNILTRILGIEVDMKELTKKAKESEKEMRDIKKMISMEKQAIEEAERGRELSENTASYIR